MIPFALPAEPFGRFLALFFLGAIIFYLIRLFKHRTEDERLVSNLTSADYGTIEFSLNCSETKFRKVASSRIMLLLTSLAIPAGSALLVITLREGDGTVWSWIVGLFGFGGALIFFQEIPKRYLYWRTGLGTIEKCEQAAPSKTDSRAG